MHPEISRAAPGACPTCGMALESTAVTEQQPDNPELVDMRRRFWISAVLTAPVFALAMAEFLPGNLLGTPATARTLTWIQLTLATP